MHCSVKNKLIDNYRDTEFTYVGMRYDSNGYVSYSLVWLKNRDAFCAAEL